MILIARSECVPALRKRLAAEVGVRIFTDSDSLRALRVILERRPKVVALDPSFAATARGAALIARVRADPTLATVDLRVLTEDETNLPVLLGQPLNSVDEAITKASRPLDQYGTRRAPRFAMKSDTVTMVNGEPSRLVNLSITGAQVLCPVRLQPNQGIRIVLLDGDRETRLRGSIAWSALEFAGADANYRAGVEFTDRDDQRLEVYCLRCGLQSDFTSVNA